MLPEEAESLLLIERTASVRVPRVRAVARDWLALEWLEPARPSHDDWARFGSALARLHRGAVAPARYGSDRDNCIGPLLQKNTPTSDWAAFWVEQRLEPQLRSLTLDQTLATKFERLFGRMGDLLGGIEDDGPSLVHGDLWSGNVHFTTGGAAIIDPACYYGHREVDLAMAALFGGFPTTFFEAYSAEWPLGAGHELRRPIYQLYYLLVHVRLFGASYLGQTRAAIDAALR
jgi:fructosamine-3-kinase